MGGPQRAGKAVMRHHGDAVHSGRIERRIGRNDADGGVLTRARQFGALQRIV